MWDKLFQVTDYLHKGLEATSLRNEVISNNIANADTPGFKVSEVKFEEVLVSAISSGGLELKATREGHIRNSVSDIGDAEPEVISAENTSYRMDGNNVDIEAQMVSLSQNNLEYYTLVNKLNSEFSKLNMAIRGGG
jgi:flagellar basal-body rod protein FlgB